MKCHSSVDEYHNGRVCNSRLDEELGKCCTNQKKSHAILYFIHLTFQLSSFQLRFLIIALSYRYFDIGTSIVRLLESKN